ncbi:MAG TPA: Ldh family oxidoreductase, partial [Ginsengibacter sp.]|nr:Ldh family oxidoreductase [Ginsengibacter sp.]
PGEGIGHFFGAMRIDAFRSAEEFKLHMDKWIQRFKSSKTIKGHERVYIPGEPETEYENERMKKGIPLLPSVVDDLKSVGDKFGIEL